MCVCGLLTLRPAGLTGGGWLIMQMGAGVSWGREVVATGRGGQLLWPRDGMMCVKVSSLQS